MSFARNIILALSYLEVACQIRRKASDDKMMQESLAHLRWRNAKDVLSRLSMLSGFLLAVRPVALLRYPFDNIGDVRTSLVRRSRLTSGSMTGDDASKKRATSQPYQHSIAFREGNLGTLDETGQYMPILEGLSNDLTIFKTSSTGGVFLKSNFGKDRHAHTSSLGKLHCRRLLACSRLTRFWMGPAFGSRAHHVPHDTQFLLLELDIGGPYVLILPLLDKLMRASLCGAASPWQKRTFRKHRLDKLLIHMESGDPKAVMSDMRSLYMVSGSDPFELMHRGFVEVAEEMESFRTLEQKQLPSSVDGFGWCTWDAFYSSVTPDGVLAGVSALHEAGVPPQTVILDDGWQEVEPSIPKSTEIVDEHEGDEKKSTNILASIATRFYEHRVRGARVGSLAPKIWGALARSLLKPSIWKYFDEQTDFNRQLADFKPNNKFESEEGDGKRRSLRSLVARCKTEFGVRQVYCWHALAGYWRGASDRLRHRGNLDIIQVQPKPSRHLLQLEPEIAWDAVTLFGIGLSEKKSDIANFYEQLHRPLAASGVDGVKVDVQSGVSAVAGSIGGGPLMAKLYTNSMEESVAKHFGEKDIAANCINCMCHSTENLYQYMTTAIARASDDFYPRRPDSHTVHLVNVAYNSLFIGEICLPDWDMFHSLHESGGLHAAARAIGGCPVYTSDVPGRSNISLLRRLVLPDGSVLRARSPGRPTRDCLFADVGADQKTALKIWNTNAIGGVVGAFHVQGVAWDWRTRENRRLQSSPQPIIARVSAGDIETLRSSGGPYAVWQHRRAHIGILRTIDEAIEIKLQHREWEIFTIMPIQRFPFDGNNGGKTDECISWAPIGLGEMLNSGGALIEQGGLVKSRIGTVQTVVASRGPGVFYAYCQPAPSRVHLEGVREKELPFRHDDSSSELRITLPELASSRFIVEWGIGEL